MSIEEEIVEENLSLRQEVVALNERIEQIHDRSVDRYVSTEAFLAQFYNTLALGVPGEWKEIGDTCGWTPEQISVAESLANALRQKFYRKMRHFER